MKANQQRWRSALRSRVAVSIVPAILLLCLFFVSCKQQATASREVVPHDFLALVRGDAATRQESLARIKASWQPSYVPMLLEVIRLINFTAPPGSFIDQLFALLKEGTGQDYDRMLDHWYAWLWTQPYNPHPKYADFKSALYSMLDPRFAVYFGSYLDVARTTKIRLDEVRWGGVAQDGIPPLRSPKMIPALKASYLADSDVVFGIAIDGDARAYPKRILAWHEMFVDEIGGEHITGVYCTLCGSMIPYKSTVNGFRHDLGTSGFLYRSNKLMYDRATQSLWSTMEGVPVIGPLADDDSIRLERLSVVTTTWGAWRARHPETTVLSLDTGHRRDYSEGAAYHSYFATDELMFNVPKLDTRLKNKAEVLGLTFPEQGKDTLAISADFLRKNRVYHDSLGPLKLVVLTDETGANRVYQSDETTFAEWRDEHSVADDQNGTWRVTEASLVAGDGRTLPRLAAHRAFWFGWYSAYPDTRLVQ